MSYFFDTYALAEIYNNSKNYERYSKINLISTSLNIAEFYTFLVRKGEKNPILVINELDFQLIEISSDLAIDAARFRLIHPKKNISWADAIGYTISNSLGLKFLTGDKEFKNLPNVEFVK